MLGLRLNFAWSSFFAGTIRKWRSRPGFNSMYFIRGWHGFLPWKVFIHRLFPLRNHQVTPIWVNDIWIQDPVRTSCHCRTTAMPNQIQLIVFRRKTIECIGFGTAADRQRQDLWIGLNNVTVLLRKLGFVSKTGFC